MLNTLVFALSVTSPIFAWLLLGFVLRLLGVLSERITNTMTALVFYISLPLLMFNAVTRFPISDILQPDIVAVCMLATLLVWWLSHLLNRYLNINQGQAPVIEQAAFRGNLGIVGLSLCLNAYGEVALAQASLLMALLTLLYNVLSVYVFVVAAADSKPSWFNIVINMLKNPLIIGVLLGAIANAVTLPIPALWFEVSQTWIHWTLPLALIAIGASLSFASLRVSAQQISAVIGFKLVLLPLMVVVTLLLLGITGMSLGMAFLLCGSPTATVSYVMAKSYGADDRLAANLVALVTLASLLSLSVGVFMLSSAGVM